MVDAPWRRSAQGDGHVQGADRQVPLQAIADSPADYAPGVEVENDGQVQPTFAGPDVADVACPFLIGSVGRETPDCR